MTSTLIGMTRKPIRFGKCRSALNSVAYPHNILTTTSYTHAQSVNSVTIPRRSFNQTFNQVIKSNGTLYVSGLIGVDEETGVFVSDSTADQTMQALTNLKKVLEQSGSSVQHVTKAKILLSNFDDLPLVNQIYSEYFWSHRNAPAVACYYKPMSSQMKIEIEAIALEIHEQL